ncbi:tetratricopeptide repeat protein [Roseococcus sp.]|uniref:tetratricopeptide repeat protein n=1 Tax=Roseococcus sp. TaxID=2109646 RepID=UPI003BA88DDF
MAGAQSDVRTSGADATANLLEQAQFWQQQGQPERALQALERLLAAEPNNVDAIAAATEAAAVATQGAVAQRYLQRLRRVAPQDARVPRLTELVRLLSEDSETLSAARGLASSGRGAEAVARYRQLFRDGNVPSVLAAEYYQTLAASSEAGYREASQQLGQRVGAAPNDLRLALTYAQILTYREESRADGVDRLQQLASRPGVREPARLAWRQGLMWLGDDAETAARIEAYLAQFPNDRELETKMRAAQRGLAPGQEARILGWADVDGRNYAEAERRFNAAIALDATDAEAVLGLAVLRKIQNRMTEARRLLERAIALAPDRAEELTRAVGDLTPYQNLRGSGGGGRGAGWVVGPSVQGWRALSRGDLDGADRFARRALSGRGQERLDGEMILGQVALQRRDFVTAEARFRNALSLRPSLRDAQTGLYFALSGQNRIAEADALQREAGLSLAGAGAHRPSRGATAPPCWTTPSSASPNCSAPSRWIRAMPGCGWTSCASSRPWSAWTRPARSRRRWSRTAPPTPPWLRPCWPSRTSASAPSSRCWTACRSACATPTPRACWPAPGANTRSASSNTTSARAAPARPRRCWPRPAGATPPS